MDLLLNNAATGCSHNISVFGKVLVLDEDFFCVCKR